MTALARNRRRFLAIAPLFLLLVMCQRAERAGDSSFCVPHMDFDGRPYVCPKRSP